MKTNLRDSVLAINQIRSLVIRFLEIWDAIALTKD